MSWILRELTMEDKEYEAFLRRRQVSYDTCREVGGGLTAQLTKLSWTGQASGFLLLEPNLMTMSSVESSRLEK